MEALLPKLLESDIGENTDLLSQFNEKYEAVKAPLDLTKDTYKEIWQKVCRNLTRSNFQNSTLVYLKTLRILSRQKSFLNDSVEPRQVSALLRLAGLCESDISTQFDHQIDFDVILEAQKCLSNMIYNSLTVQKECSSTQHISALVHRLRSFKESDFPLKIKAFYVRILFLLSALRSELRSVLNQEYHCMSYLGDAMVYILDNNLPDSTNYSQSNPRSFDGVILKEEHVDILVDILKALYNLATNINRVETDEEQKTNCSTLLTIVRSLLLVKGPNLSLTYHLHSNCANLILLMPPSLYGELLSKITRQTEFANEGSEQVEDSLSNTENRLNSSTCRTENRLNACTGRTENCLNPCSCTENRLNPCSCTENRLNSCTRGMQIVEYDGYDMSSIVTLLDLLQFRLSEHSCAGETLTPILTLFVELTRNVREIRKFVRLRVLPPLRDVSKRPEEGAAVKNRLCLLMTSPVPDLKYLSANFLFVLCKENVNRLIKYTGYGNAAGLLASRGLMAGGPLKKDGQYSSDTDDSDTEEYDQVKDKVNPVIGCYEDLKPSPLNNMSDEQKEFEAMKLVEALDKMSRSNLIQPCSIGEDGRPHPVNNLVEFRDSILNQNGSGRDNAAEEGDQ